MRHPVAVLLLAGIVLEPWVARSAEPVCGDVNGTASVSASDALLVLQKGVNLPITLDCSGYDTKFSACETALSEANANLSTCNSDLGSCSSDLLMANASLTTCNTNLTAALACGNAVLDTGEDCEFGHPGIGTCASEGFVGGILTCGAGCKYDTSGCANIRYTDNSDGTITDSATGLMWERKDDAGGVHDKDNTYTWSTSGTAPDGSAFTSFLASLNEDQFAGHSDWRLPTEQELKDILVMDAVGCGTGGACVDPAFEPTQANVYWSSTEDHPFFAFVVAFHDGGYAAFYKLDPFFVRAVRSGP